MNDLLYVWQLLSSVEFILPWLVVALPLPYFVRKFWSPAEQQQTALHAPQLFNRFSQAEGTKLQVQNQAKIGLLGWLIWLAIVLTAMRPVWYESPTPFKMSGKDMILAVDLSGSMEKNDMVVGAYPVDRLTAVKSVVHEFIQQRQGDRMGLVVFGSQAFFQSPLTYDLKALQQLLEEAQIGMAGNNTAIGDAIGITLKHLPKTSESQQHKPVLILLTDGSNTAGSVKPIDAAEKAAKAGLKIYTIGIGQTNRRGIDAFLSLSSRDMDIQTLKMIAERTQGEFFLANDTRQLDDIYETINQLESNEHEVNQYRLKTELYPWPLGFAFLMLLALTSYKRYNKQGRSA